MSDKGYQLNLVQGDQEMLTGLGYQLNLVQGDQEMLTGLRKFLRNVR